MADDRNPPDGYAPGNPPPPPPVEGVTPVPPWLEPRPQPEATRRPPQTPTAAGRQAEANEMKDSFREIIETVVFVVVLVLLLKTFLAEAFVIPTGSMATTLLGYHREVVCDKCNYPFLVNASSEADPQERVFREVVSCTCPNCAFTNVIRPELNGGRR